MKVICIVLLALVLLQFETIKQVSEKCGAVKVYNVTNGRER